METYKLLHGDPETNGLGHQLQLNTKWKDGSYRDCVRIPLTKDDEMEVEWNQNSVYAHTTEISNGDMVDSARAAHDIFTSLQDTHGKNFIVGKAVVPKPPPSLQPVKS